MITPFSAVPSRQRPSVFASEMDQFLSELSRFVGEANSLEQSLQLTATTGTSVSTLSVVTGSMTVQTQAGKAWVAGAFVYLVSAASAANFMHGQVLSYNTTSGVMVVNVLAVSGAGTYSAWVIGLAVPSASTVVYAGSVSATSLLVDANFYMAIESGRPVIRLGADDYLEFNRTSGYLITFIDGSTRFYVSASDGPARNEDATTANGLVRKQQVDSGLMALAGGGFRGLQLSAGGASSSINVSADALMVMSPSLPPKVISPSLTINSAAIGANGLDAGSISSNTWYAVWVLYNPGTDVIEGRISLSSSSPTVSSGFTHKARVGWIRTDGTANKYPLGFKQYGRRVQYVVASGSNVSAYPVLISGVQGSLTVPTYIAASTSGFVPPTSSVIDLIAIRGNNTSSTIAAAPSSAFGSSTNDTNPPPLMVSMNTAGSPVSISSRGSFVLESSNIYCFSDGAANSLRCTGWEDNL